MTVRGEGDGEAALEEITRRLAREGDARVAAMRARGEEPAPTDGILHVGYPRFGVGLRPEGGSFETRLSLGVGEPAWGEGWPGRGVLIPAQDLLDALAAAFPSAAGDGPCRITLRPGGEGMALPPVLIERDRDGLTVSCAGRSTSYGREGVVVIQALRAAGDIVSASLPAGCAAREAWAGARASADLPPIAIMGEGAPDTLDEETAWFARRLGVDESLYRLAAIDVMARQYLHAHEDLPEPVREEWRPAFVPDGLDEDGVMARAGRAAALAGTTPEAFAEDAVASRNSDAFQAVFYAPAGEPARDEPVTPGPR